MIKTKKCVLQIPQETKISSWFIETFSSEELVKNQELLTNPPLRFQVSRNEPSFFSPCGEDKKL